MTTQSGWPNAGGRTIYAFHHVLTLTLFTAILSCWKASNCKHVFLPSVHFLDLFHARTEDENKSCQVRWVWQNMRAKGIYLGVGHLCCVRRRIVVKKERPEVALRLLPLGRFSLCRDIQFFVRHWVFLTEVKIWLKFHRILFLFRVSFFSCFIAFCETKWDKSLRSTSDQKNSTRLCRFVKR